MPDTVKYTFDQAFDGGARSRYDMEVAQLREQIEIARREGYDAGHQAGVAETRVGLEAQASEIMSMILKSIADFEQEQQRITKLGEAEFVSLAAAIAEEINLAAKADQADAEFKALCAEALSLLVDEPQITLRVPELVAEVMTTAAQKAAEQIGYTGSLKVETDPGLTPPNCRLVWTKGQIAFSDTAVQDQIKSLVSGYLDRLNGEIEALEGSE